MESVEEKKFDSFLNKTIIMSSRKYFLKTMNRIDKERTIVDDEEYSSYINDRINSKSGFTTFEDANTKMELSAALNCLSDIEQAVIFLLFNEELTQQEAADILEVYSKTVSKIKIRAIEKLKKHMEGDFENEK